jgi:GxxExxY protein
MIRPYTELEGLTQRIIQCAIEVHRELGPGLLESVYKECLIPELRSAGLKVEYGKAVPIIYKGQKVATNLVVDILVEEKVVVELKAVESLHPVHEAQLITYLKLTGCPAGLLINFNAVLLKQGLRRVDHPSLYVRKPKPQ